MRDLIAADFGIGILPRRMVKSAVSRHADVRRLPVCESALPAALVFVVAWLQGDDNETGDLVAQAAMEADQTDTR